MERRRDRAGAKPIAAGKMTLLATPTRSTASAAASSSRRSMKSLLSDVPSMTPTPMTPTATPPMASTPLDDKENCVTPNSAATPVAPKRTPERIYETVLDADGNATRCSYLKGRFLGKGGFASCYEVVCERTSRKYACKMVTKRSLAKPKAKLKFKSEIKIHKALRHPNVVQFERYFEDDDNAYILLELCRNQSLSDLMRRRKRLSEAEVRFYIRQLVDGLAYLHKNLVIHRDLKLGNLFITADMKLKIGDFGLAALLDNELDRKTTLCGTPNYIAPEILTGRSTTGHSFEVDIWSMGVVMYTLLVGKPPFETKDVKETYKRIRVGEFSFPPEVEISESSKSLVRSMLQVDPRVRPSLSAILAHTFFSERPTMSSLPKTALLITPPECKRAIASNKRSMDARSYEQPPPRYPLRRRDINRERERAVPSTVVAAPPVKYESAPQAPVANANDIDTTLVLKSDVSDDKSMNSKKSAGWKKSAAGFNASRATTATSDTPVPTVDENRAMEDAKDPFHVVKDTLSRFFYLEEHGGQNEETLDEFSSASVIVAAAKRVKEIRLEQEAARTQPLVPAPLWLSQWVDYTSKYGMGYVLSDGSSGVYFNDSTKIIASPDGKALEYIERVEQLSGAPEPFVRCPTASVDQALKKKVTLMAHFKSYLIDERERKPEITAFELETKELTRSSEQPSAATESDRMVYVKKWVKTKHAVLFFLSNHTFQLNFYDTSKLILSPCGRVASYVDKEGKLGVFSTAVAILNREPSDLTKRLRYARDMFEQIARLNAAAATAQAVESAAVKCEKA